MTQEPKLSHASFELIIKWKDNLRCISEHCSSLPLCVNTSKAMWPQLVAFLICDRGTKYASFELIIKLNADHGYISDNCSSLTLCVNRRKARGPQLVAFLSFNM